MCSSNSITNVHILFALFLKKEDHREIYTKIEREVRKACYFISAVHARKEGSIRNDSSTQYNT